MRANPNKRPILYMMTIFLEGMIVWIILGWILGVYS